MTIQKLMAAAAWVVVLGVAAQASAQQAGGYWSGTHDPNLFQQYYTAPGVSSATAALYPAPHPVPHTVGYSNYTYQPLMPHELMWQHSRNYYNYYAGPESFYADPCNYQGGGGALTKTTVVWQSGANHMGPLPGSIGFLAKRQYQFAARQYGLTNGGQRGYHRLGAGCQSGNCGSAGCSSCGK